MEFGIYTSLAPPSVPGPLIDQLRSLDQFQRFSIPYCEVQKTDEVLRSTAIQYTQVPCNRG